MGIAAAAYKQYAAMYALATPQERQYLPTPGLRDSESFYVAPGSVAKVLLAYEEAGRDVGKMLVDLINVTTGTYEIDDAYTCLTFIDAFSREAPWCLSEECEDDYS